MEKQEKNLEDMTVIQLREILKGMGLKVSGRKAELIQRIGEARGDKYSSKQKKEVKAGVPVKALTGSPVKPSVKVPADMPLEDYFSLLPKDVAVQIALELDIPDLFSFCLSSRRNNDLACASDSFWRRKIEHDMRKFMKKDVDYPKIQDAKEYYKKIRKDYRAFLNKSLEKFVKSGELKKVIRSIQLGANPNSRDIHPTLLEIAVENGQYDVVVYLLDNHKMINKEEALVKALNRDFEADKYRIAKKILSSGVDLSYDYGWILDLIYLTYDKELKKIADDYVKKDRRFSYFDSDYSAE